MKKVLFTICLAFLIIDLIGQKAEVTPTIAPSLFRPGDEITVTYNVTGTPLANLSSAFIWVWIPDQTIDAKYNVNPASSDVTKSNHAKFTKSTVEGKTFFSLTFTPSEFFDADISQKTQIGMLLKGDNWSNGQTIDYIASFWDGSFQIKLNSPTEQPLFVSPGETISIEADVPIASDFSLFVNDIIIDLATATTTYEFEYTIPHAPTSSVIKIEAVSGGTTAETSFQYIVSQASPAANRPPGTIAGINYGADPSKVVLCLQAPGKSSVYVRGDFNDWKIDPAYLMKRDGELFWLEVSGLVSGKEYAFQYLVNEELYIADPYSEKVLDPDDQYIPATVYPGLKQFPQQARSDKWYFNRVSVLQTNQPEYDWQVEDFDTPRKENLVVYELLIRDLFDQNNRSYQSLIDKISYLKRLGVNAVELMPIMEFNGNESWGYNPAFMFAPDKYYGPKNKLKEFVDKCHAEGIAVILDIAMNHQDLPNPMVMLDFDFSAGRPTPNNRWFHEMRRHPFNVFFDMNHDSPYTRTYLDTVNHYWLNEYKIDGFRFDLSKGFTAVNYCTTPNCDSDAEVAAWSSRDQSRINNLKRMTDAIWSHSPDAIVILEHLAVNEEEKELAEYRADEGKGMLLWGNMNHAYGQLTMGYVESSDISGTSHEKRNWDVPHLVSYMESHDEERLAYKNKQWGKTSAKDPRKSLERIAAASAIFYSIPGPKMLWQFGEVGFDYSINRCEDGSVNNDCRLSPKPVTWNYSQESGRYSLMLVTSELIKLHTTYSVFANGVATVTQGNSLVKQVQVKNQPYTDSPTTPDQMNVVALANFEEASIGTTVTFPHAGVWYDYFNGGQAISVTSLTQQITLPAGGFKLLTDVQIGAGPVTSIDHELLTRLSAYPNPTTGKVKIDAPISNLRIIDSKGVSRPFRIADGEVDLSDLASGIYILQYTNERGLPRSTKIIKD